MHYLDNAATTKVYEASARVAYDVMVNGFGNPSSSHKMGISAEMLLSECRKNIASSIGCNPNELYFTSGGTESDNLAILGCARAYFKSGNHIICTTIEHPAVLNAVKQLESEGFEVTYISPKADGTVDAEDFSRAVTPRTVLVCCMLANNETGAIMPVHDISVAVKRKNPNVKVFSDCVQAFLKMHFTVSSIGADLISITGHKVHAPKGCGALYVKEGALIRPIIYGGGQEKKLRSGTESLPLIAAFSEAVKIGSSSLEDNIEKTQALHDFAVSELSKIDGVSILDIHGLPHVISMSLKGAKSEVLLRVLESEGVYVSSGSACAKGKKSHVLTNMGLPNAVIDSTLRISMDHTNTKDDILALARSIENAKILF